MEVFLQGTEDRNTQALKGQEEKQGDQGGDQDPSERRWLRAGVQWGCVKRGLDVRLLAG